MKKSQSSEKSSNNTSPSQDKKNYIEIEERVRYSEVDRMGVAHNKNYFEWFEIGRTEYCRLKNIPYRSIEEQGYYLVVVEAFCKYKKTLLYDEKFIIRVSLDEVSPKKFVFSYELVTRQKRKLIASGYTVHIVTNSEAKVCSLPPEIMEKITA